MEAVSAVHELFSSCRGPSWPLVSVEAIEGLLQHHLQQSSAIDEDEDLSPVFSTCFPHVDPHGDMDFLTFWKGMESLLSSLGLQDATVASDSRLRGLQFFRDGLLSRASAKSDLFPEFSEVLLDKHEVEDVIIETGKKVTQLKRKGRGYDGDAGGSASSSSGGYISDPFWDDVYEETSRLEESAQLSVAELSSMVFGFLQSYVQRKNVESERETARREEGDGASSEVSREGGSGGDFTGRSDAEDEEERSSGGHSRVTSCVSGPVSSVIGEGSSEGERESEEEEGVAVRGGRRGARETRQQRNRRSSETEEEHAVNQERKREDEDDDSYSRPGEGMTSGPLSPESACSRPPDPGSRLCTETVYSEGEGEYDELRGGHSRDDSRRRIRSKEGDEDERHDCIPAFRSEIVMSRHGGSSISKSSNDASSCYSRGGSLRRRDERGSPMVSDDERREERSDMMSKRISSEQLEKSFSRESRGDALPPLTRTVASGSHRFEADAQERRRERPTPPHRGDTEDLTHAREEEEGLKANGFCRQEEESRSPVTSGVSHRSGSISTEQGSPHPVKQAPVPRSSSMKTPPLPLDRTTRDLLPRSGSAKTWTRGSHDGGDGNSNNGDATVMSTRRSRTEFFTLSPRASDGRAHLEGDREVSRDEEGLEVRVTGEKRQEGHRDSLSERRMKKKSSADDSLSMDDKRRHSNSLPTFGLSPHNQSEQGTTPIVSDGSVSPAGSRLVSEGVFSDGGRTPSFQHRDSSSGNEGSHSSDGNRTERDPRGITSQSEEDPEGKAKLHTGETGGIKNAEYGGSQDDDNRSKRGQPPSRKGVDGQKDAVKTGRDPANWRDWDDEEDEDDLRQTRSIRSFGSDDDVSSKGDDKLWRGRKEGSHDHLDETSTRERLVSSLAEALRRLEETCSVSNASDSKSEQQKLLRHQQRFIARALEAAEQLQVQSSQAEEDFRMLTESAGRLRQEKLQLLERLKALESKMDDRQPEDLSAESTEMRDRIESLQWQLEEQKKAVREKDEQLRRVIEERDNLQETASSVQRSCTRKVEDLNRHSQKQLQEQREDIKALKEEREALQEELRRASEKLKLSQAAAAAVSCGGGKSGCAEQESEGGAAALRLRVREIENIREALELEVEEKDAFIARLQKQNEDSQQRASELDVKWRQSSRLVQQLRQVRDRLLMAEEQWKEEAEKDRERMVKIFQEAAAGGDAHTSRTNASSARSMVSSADSAVASANERIQFIQKEREAARLHTALGAAQAHIKELEGFIDEMRREQVFSLSGKRSPVPTLHSHTSMTYSRSFSPFPASPGGGGGAGSSRLTPPSSTRHALIEDNLRRAYTTAPGKRNLLGRHGEEGDERKTGDYFNYRDGDFGEEGVGGEQGLPFERCRRRSSALLSVSGGGPGENSTGVSLEDELAGTTILQSSGGGTERKKGTSELERNASSASAPCLSAPKTRSEEQHYSTKQEERRGEREQDLVSRVKLLGAGGEQGPETGITAAGTQPTKEGELIDHDPMDSQRLEEPRKGLRREGTNGTEKGTERNKMSQQEERARVDEKDNKQDVSTIQVSWENASTLASGSGDTEGLRAGTSSLSRRRTEGEDGGEQDEEEGSQEKENKAAFDRRTREGPSEAKPENEDGRQEGDRAGTRDGRTKLERNEGPSDITAILPPPTAHELTDETLRKLENWAEEEEGGETLRRRRRKSRPRREGWEDDQSGSNSSYSSFLVDVSVAGSSVEDDEEDNSTYGTRKMISPALSGRSRCSARHSHRKITPLRSGHRRYGVATPHRHSGLSCRRRSVSTHSRTSNRSHGKLRRHGSTRSQLTVKTDRSSAVGDHRGKKEATGKSADVAGEGSSSGSKGGRYGLTSSTSTPTRRLDGSPAWSKNGERRDRGDHAFPTVSSSTKHENHLKLSKDGRLRSVLYGSRKSSSQYHGGSSTGGGGGSEADLKKQKSRHLDGEEVVERTREGDLIESGLSGRVFSVPHSDVRGDAMSKNGGPPLSSWWGRWSEAVTTPSPQRSKRRGVVTSGLSSSSSSQLDHHQHAEDLSRGDRLIPSSLGDAGIAVEGDSKSPDFVSHPRRTLGSVARSSPQRDTDHHGAHNEGSTVGASGERETNYFVSTGKGLLTRRLGKEGEVPLSRLGSSGDTGSFLGDTADHRRKSGDFHALGAPKSPSSHVGNPALSPASLRKQEEERMSVASSARSTQLSAPNLSPPVSLRSRQEQLQHQHEEEHRLDPLHRRATDDRRRIVAAPSGQQRGETSHSTSVRPREGRGSASSLRGVAEADIRASADPSVVCPGGRKESDVHSLVNALGSVPERKPQGSRSEKGEKRSNRTLPSDKSAENHRAQETDPSSFVSSWVDTLTSSFAGYEADKGAEAAERPRSSGKVGKERRPASLRQDEKVRTAEAALFTPPGPRSPLSAGAAGMQRSRNTTASPFMDSAATGSFPGSSKQRWEREYETEDRENWLRRQRTSDAQRKKQLGRDEKYTTKNEDKGSTVSRDGGGSVASTPAESSRSDLGHRRQIRLSHRSGGSFETNPSDVEALRGHPSSSSLSTSSGRTGRKEGGQEKAFSSASSVGGDKRQGQSKVGLSRRSPGRDDDEENEKGSWSGERRRFFSKKSSSEEDRDAPGPSGSPGGRTRRGDSHSSSSGTTKSSRPSGRDAGGEREGGRGGEGGRTAYAPRYGESAQIIEGNENLPTGQTVASLPNQYTHRSDRLSTHRSKDSSCTDFSARGYGPSSSRSQGSTHTSSLASSERFSASPSLQSSLELTLPPLGKLYAGQAETANTSIDLSDTASSPVSTTAPSSASSGSRHHRVAPRKLVKSVVKGAAMGSL